MLEGTSVMRYLSLIAAFSFLVVPGAPAQTLEADGQSTQFTFDTSGGDAQSDDFQPETWSFTATDSRTRLYFRSLDHHSNCGPVVAAISVTAN